ncbi:hypothetical protein A2V56_04050 [Candidatus Woesebacteria bacterium RBG_19FT_COMBO_42_9]|uniref:Uncharacterized protein n=1 Tax=Candidatus Woesebacteria bacterium RBG_16_42_24 TaxID=1802485 RepID=A0A1F7XJQ9_9BACT|nr:MAG: hypothetical protein A2V97_01315 [Candidatus Woesebacteria bacterium RBG_16_42_24]OGM17793.1 MAG: hypothetical protein A2V56_04050 [Candidatus Woesebacteria bacterium RBG_19FT_COMBO_42_9]OGM68068.1 MAG: hypothetical protein A2985_03285 [Candidatus Woesebacteria bacterium RIFCSPLOWO2_01_FULL_43_11]
MIVYLEKPATYDEIKRASEEFGTYIKISVDILRKVAVIGGKLHADEERLLLEKGSKQENIWGGGYDMKSGRIDSQAVINIRPGKGNDSMEILDPNIRKNFLSLAKKFLK